LGSPSSWTNSTASLGLSSASSSDALVSSASNETNGYSCTNALPPPRDDVPLLATRAAPVFAECDSVLNGSVSATRLTSNSDVTHIPNTLFPVSSFVTVSPGLGATNALGSPSTWTNSTASLGLNSTPTVCSFPIGFHPGDERGDARSPDARDAPVPSWLNRLFHPPER